MSEGVWIALIGATVPSTLAAIGYAVVQTIKYIRAQAKIEALYETATIALAEKDETIDQWKTDYRTLLEIVKELAK